MAELPLLVMRMAPVKPLPQELVTSYSQLPPPVPLSLELVALDDAGGGVEERAMLLELTDGRLELDTGVLV